MKRYNLGCGNWSIPNYINVDIRDLPHVDMVADVRHLEMIETGSADEVFAKDVLEHVPRREWQATLDEWLRLLKPGGILKIRFPDMLRLFKAYSEGRFNKNLVYGTDTNNQDECDRFAVERLGQLLFGDQNVPENAHLTGLTDWLVIRYLTSKGMTILKTWVDGYADVRITASKGEPDSSISLDHPDYGL